MVKLFKKIILKLQVAYYGTLLVCGILANAIFCHRSKLDYMTAWTKNKFSGLDWINSAGLKDVIHRFPDHVILLDVRTLRERSVSRIPHSIHVDEWEKSRRPLSSSDLQNTDAVTPKKVITYCTVGLRSALRARELMEMGYPAVNLEGGILKWWTEGNDLIDGYGRKADKVHPYSPIFAVKKVMP